MQVTGSLSKRIVVTSGGGSAACDLPSAPNPPRPAAPANAALVRNRRRVWVIGIKAPIVPGSRLQLAFELVEEAPIRAAGDNPLGRRLDHADFVQPKRIKADRVLGVVVAPFVVRDLVQRLQCIIIARGEPAIDEASRGAARFGSAEVCRLENRAQYPLCGDGVGPHVIGIAAQQAA